MRRFTMALAWLVRTAPAAVVVTALVLTGVLGWLSTEVQTSTGSEGFAPDNPELLASETIAERFGSGDEVVQILLTAENGGDLISPEGIQAVGTVTSAIQSSPAGEYLAQRPERPPVTSFLAPLQQAGDAPASDNAAVDQAFRQALGQLPPDQAGLVTALLPEDADPAEARADAGLVLVFLDTNGLPSDPEARFEQLTEIETGLAEAIAEADLPAGVSAEPFSFALLFANSDDFAAEVGRLFGLAFLIILVILGAVYWVRPSGRLSRLGALRRALADMLLTMLAIVMAITWMQGLAALLGPGYLGWIGGLTEVTQVLPVLLIGLGVDYAIHLTSRYREELAEGARVAGAMERAGRTVGIALVLATMTTAVGFLTNVVNPVPALKDFGILAAFGILSAFVLMLTFLPAARLLLDRRAERAGRLPHAEFRSTNQRFLPELMARTAVLAERLPVLTLVVTVGLGGALGAWGLSELETRFSFTDFVPEDDPIVVTYDTIQERFGGGFGETTQVLLTGPVTTPEAHNALAEAQRSLRDLPDVVQFGDQAAAQSPVSVLAQAAQADPQLAARAADLGLQPDGTVTADADVAALYGLLLEVAPEQTAQVLATDAGGAIDVARVELQTTAGESGAAELAGQLREAFAPMEEAGVEAVPTSEAIINDVIVTALSDSQVSSLAITLIAAMLLLVATFWFEARRPFLGVVTIAPVALVVLWTFGMMAATGIPFGPVTATIAALAIGIGVPYTIHIAHRFQEDRSRLPDLDAAIRSTVRHTGGALAGSAFTTMAGFGVLVTSSLTPFRQFGLVTAYAIGFALLAATLVLPSMLALWDRWHQRRGGAAVDEPTAEPAPV